MLVESLRLRFAVPVLKVPRIATLPTGTASDVYQALEGAAECPMRQGWRDEPEPRFRPATVRVAAHGSDLVVAAELVDDDIFNPITKFNEPAFPHGDVFEIFLRPEHQEAYYELHVSPTNHRFQLRIPSATHFRLAQGASSLEPWKVHQPLVRSRVHVDPKQKKWWVLAVVPFTISENGAVGPGSRWQFSFCRYDYTRGCDQPVLSSTSPYVMPDYHRQSEWGWLEF